MTIFVSIVSHLDHDVIINLGTIKKLAEYKNIQVVCRDNQPVNKLHTYCEKYGAVYLPNKYEQGFATNNNKNFLYCQEKLGMKASDIFLLLNPDIYICESELEKLVHLLENNSPKIATCDLFLDREYMVRDDNIRRFPRFINFIKTYLLNDRSTMVKRKSGFTLLSSHWFSCSFMAVEASIYAKLKGLDEKYYLYCEDIDFSYRARLSGEATSYMESIKAVHYRRRDSKRFLSKYFFWHVCSVFKYSFSRKKITAKKSCLTTDLK